MSTTDKKIDDLAAMVANGFTDLHAEISEIRESMTTKEDLANLRRDVDIMLDRHIGTFRKDYDELASRVKKLEELVLNK